MSTQNHFDVIIIGTGAGGGTLAHKLAPTGKKILLLERGGYVPREKDNWNPRAVNLDEELRRFEYKVKAGANFAMTQPVFDVWGLREFLKRVRSIAGREVSIVASLWPLTSFRKAEFLNNEVPGVSIPPAVMERMRKADTGDRAREEGVRIAQETLVEIRDLVEAVQIASPFGRYAMAVEVAEVLKKEEVRSQKSGGSRQ